MLDMVRRLKLYNTLNFGRFFLEQTRRHGLWFSTSRWSEDLQHNGQWKNTYTNSCFQLSAMTNFLYSKVVRNARRNATFESAQQSYTECRNNIYVAIRDKTVAQLILWASLGILFGTQSLNREWVIVVFKLTVYPGFFLKLLICGEHFIIIKTVFREVKKKKKFAQKHFKMKTIIFHDSQKVRMSHANFLLHVRTAFNRFPSRLSREKHINVFLSFFLWQCICKTSGWRKSKREAKKDELWWFTWQEKSLVHSELVRKSNMAEVFLALANGRDVTALPKDLHDELLCGVLWQTADKHGLTPWRALPCGWRGKVCSKDVEWRQKHSVLFPRAAVRQTH